MVKSRELRQKLGELADGYRKLIDVGHEKRTAEQNTEMDKLETDIAATEKEIRRVDEQEVREKALADPNRPGIRLDPALDPGRDERLKARAVEFRKQYAADKSAEMRTAQISEFIEQDIPLSRPEYRAAYGRFLQLGKGALKDTELRDLAMGAAASGGYTVPQQEFVAELIKRIDEENVIRGLATKYTVAQAQTMGQPSLANNPANADWTIELGTGNDDTQMSFGLREMRPWPVAKRILVSEKLLRASPLGAEAIVRGRLAYIIGITHSTAFNTGDGASKPLGIYTASPDGIPVGQDQSIVTASAPDPDKVILAYYALRPVYRAKAVWHFSPTWLAQFRKLKTTSPIAYLWQPGLALGAPSTFLGNPYKEDEFAPTNTAVGAGNYAAVLGDFSFYHIVDALDMRIQRLDELYAATGQVGFIVRAESDAQPVLGEAFVRLLND